MAKKNLIYEAITDFYLGGQYIPSGATVVHGHPLLKGRTKLFRPFVPTFGSVEGIEVPDSEPEPEPEPKPTKAEKAQAAEDQKEATEANDAANAEANADGAEKV